jgi:hsp70-interacting protein
LLVEQIDNASNLEVLKLWPPLLSLLSSPEPELRRYAAWVTGTAVQNNPKAQGHLLHYKGVRKLVEKLEDEYSVRTKVLYALGSELNNFPAGVKQFREYDGWKKMRRCVDGVSEGIECQRRAAFFLANYLAEDGVSTEEIEGNGFLQGFLDILGDEKYTSQPDLIDKVRVFRMTLIQTLQAVTMLITKRIDISDKQSITKLRNILPILKSKHHESIDQETWKTLEKSLDTL